MVSVSGSVGSNDNMVGIGYSQRFGEVSEFDGMTDEELRNALAEMSDDMKAVKEENKALTEHFAQNEARNKAMEQENVALKAQLAEMNFRMEALTARLDTLSSAAK